MPAIDGGRRITFIWAEDQIQITKPRHPGDGQIDIVYRYVGRIGTVDAGSDSPELVEVGDEELPPGPDSQALPGLDELMNTVWDDAKVAKLKVRGTFDEDYEKGETLGSGNYGTVWKAVNRHTGQVFAAKLVKNKSNPPGAGNGRYFAAQQGRHGKGGGGVKYDTPLKEEIAIMKACSTHHCVVKYVHEYGVYKQEGCKDNEAWLILEYCPDGQLYNKMDSHKRGCFAEIHARTLFAQVIRALAHIHLMGIVHRDIKPDNILLRKYKYVPTAAEIRRKGLKGDAAKPQLRYLAKVADFGMARIVGYGDAGQGVRLHADDVHIQTIDKIEDSQQSTSQTASSLIHESLETSMPIRRARSIVGTPRYLAPEVYLSWKKDSAANEVRDRRAAEFKANKNQEGGEWESWQPSDFQIGTPRGGFADGCYTLDLVVPWLTGDPNTGEPHPVAKWWHEVVKRKYSYGYARRLSRSSAMSKPSSSAADVRAGQKRRAVGGNASGSEDEDEIDEFMLTQHNWPEDEWGLTERERAQAAAIDLMEIVERRDRDVSVTPMRIGECDTTRARMTIAACMRIDAAVRHGYDGVAADAFALGGTIHMLLSNDYLVRGSGPGDKVHQDSGEQKEQEKAWRFLVVPEEKRLPKYELPALTDMYHGRTKILGWSKGNSGDILPSHLQQMLLGCVTFTADRWVGISNEARDIIMRLTRPDPSARLTVYQALQHPWFKNRKLTVDRWADFERTTPRFGPKIDAGFSPGGGGLNRTSIITEGSMSQLSGASQLDDDESQPYAFDVPDFRAHGGGELEHSPMPASAVQRGAKRARTDDPKPQCD